MKTTLPPTFWTLSGVLALSALLPLPGRDGRIAHLPTVCPFYQLTGLPCPGCGMTRAFVCLGHGHFAQSLHWHPLGFVFYAACVAVWAALGWEAWRGRPMAWIQGQQAGRWSAAGLVLLLGIGAARIGWVWANGGQWPS